MSPCEMRACENGGSCVTLPVHSDAGEEMYSFCNCLAGFTGDLCQSLIDDCTYRIYRILPSKRLLDSGDYGTFNILQHLVIPASAPL